MWLQSIPDMPLSYREVVRSKQYQCEQLSHILYGTRWPVRPGVDLDRQRLVLH